MVEIKNEFVGSKGKKEKQVLLESLEGIIQKLNERIKDSTVTVNELRLQKDAMVEEFNKNLQREKEHFNKVKQFEAECDKNELLMNQIKEIKKEKKRQEAA